QCESGGEKGSCRQGAPDGACSGHVRSSRLKGLWKNLSRTCSKRKRPAEPTDGSPRAGFIGSAPTQGSLNPAFPSGSARDGRADLVAAGEVQAHVDRVGGVGADGQVELAVLAAVGEAVTGVVHEQGRVALLAVHADVEEAREVVLVGREGAGP